MAFFDGRRPGEILIIAGNPANNRMRRFDVGGFERVQPEPGRRIGEGEPVPNAPGGVQTQGIVGGFLALKLVLKHGLANRIGPAEWRFAADW